MYFEKKKRKKIGEEVFTKRIRPSPFFKRTKIVQDDSS